MKVPKIIWIPFDKDFRCCPNKRVAHLAFYAKKPRTRKKNLNRVIKILEKM